MPFALWLVNADSVYYDGPGLMDRQDDLAAPDLTDRPFNRAQAAMVRRRVLADWLLPIGLAALLTGIMWAPALFQSRIIVQMDAVMLSMPLMDLGDRAFNGTDDVLWSPNVYGGHPIFAEGQGAYANPIVLVFAKWVTPALGAARAATLIHCVFLVLGAIGMTGLCRVVGVGRWGCCLAVAAAVFSPAWVRVQHNLPISASAMWVPWVLWAGESWLVRPGLAAAGALGAAMALMLLSGYPQTLHATLLYLMIRALLMFADRSSREDLRATWRRRLGTGGFAGLVAAGLSAVQLLPLVELIGESHREGGTGLWFQKELTFFLNGLLYDVLDFSKLPINDPTVGSVLVSALALASLLRFRDRRILGHFSATVLLLNFSMGTGSAIFQLFYDSHLLFGLHYFRLTLINMIPSTVGVGLLAAVGAEEIARRLAGSSGRFRDVMNRRGLSIAGATIAATGAVLVPLHECQNPYLQFGIPIAALVGASALYAARRGRLLPPLLAGLVVVEVLGLRAAPYHFFDADLVSRPGTISAIQQRPDWREFKLLEMTRSMEFGYMDARNPAIGAAVQRAFAAGAGDTPLLWGLSSITGHLALPLKRHLMINAALHDEAGGRPGRPLGSRLIDLLGVGYVSSDAPLATPGLELLAKGDDRIWIYRNTAARPRFQFFDHSIAAPSPEAALYMLAYIKTPTLVVETAASAAPPGSLEASSRAPASPPELVVVDERATAYKLLVTSAAPTWLFMADANYPGWTASIDGKPTPVFTGQVLGKALWLPAGRHVVGLQYTSRPFVWGRAITVASLALLLLLGAFGLWRGAERREV